MRKNQRKSKNYKKRQRKVVQYLNILVINYYKMTPKVTLKSHQKESKLPGTPCQDTKSNQILKRYEPSYKKIQLLFFIKHGRIH